MKLLDYITKETILTDLKSTDKKGVIDELAEPVAKETGLDHRAIVRVLLERERLGSTGIGGGIAIPHGKIEGIESLVLGFGLSRQGIDFEALDNKPAHIFFMLLSADNSTGLHLRVLARLSKLLKDQSFKQKLIQTNSASAVMGVLREADEEL